MKKTFKYFTIFEYEEEQNYLRAMHRAGWKFVRVSGLCVYHFEKCVPEDVIYQLDYNRDGVAHKDEYVKMFSDCGWEYLQDYMGYSYFRKPAREAAGSEEIFCDDASRLQMLERIFRGRVIPLLLLFFVILIPEFIIYVYRGEAAVAMVLGVMIGLYLLILAQFASQYTKLRSRR